ncbi:MAG: DoxX family protein [Hyphomicrobiales bacterium]
MSAILSYDNTKEHMWLPSMSGFYDSVAQPLAWVGLRVLTGGMLVVAGWPKIMAPMAQAQFVEGLYFYPGWFWSPFLAVLQFFGGMAICVGLFTRPIALANAVMLAVTLWFHWANPYGDRFLTDAGVEFMKTGGAQYFTPEAVRHLADGGAAFLDRVQEKADWLSLLWTGTAAFFAAFGGGSWSVDRNILKKEF